MRFLDLLVKENIVDKHDYYEGFNLTVEKFEPYEFKKLDGMNVFDTHLTHKKIGVRIESGVSYLTKGDEEFPIKTSEVSLCEYDSQGKKWNPFVDLEDQELGRCVATIASIHKTIESRSDYLRFEGNDTLWTVLVPYLSAEFQDHEPLLGNGGEILIKKIHQ
jgi:hypothetical protein